MTNRLHIVQLFYTFDVEVGGGGLSRFAIELGKNLDPDKFEVSLVSLGYFDSGSGKERIQKLNEQGLDAFEATRWEDEKPYQSFFKSVKFLRAKFSHKPPDILHSHSEFTDITALLLKIRANPPKIMRTVHYGHQYEWSTKPLRRAVLTNFLYPFFFDQEIGINKFNTARLNRRYIARLLGKQAINLPNAINLEGLKRTSIDIASKKKSLGIPVNSLIIGTVGRLADQKGYRYLIDAVPKILSDHPQAHFMIIGEGPLSEELKEQADQLNVSSNVKFTGSRSDVGELYACMEIFVSSSLFEGLPTVIMESMASNVPVLATSIPGTDELVQHGVNGWLVPPKDPIALGKGISHLINSPNLRRELVANARDSVRRYSISSVAKKYEEIYLRI
ncbi:MAG: glycosyltransferase family 4 protein [Candidatus Kariarchaeaceae archaeon]|jgi:glycosyltransferase involved in cell wall biosynthesis